jgi:hypothetical protein
MPGRGTARQRERAGEETGNANRQGGRSARREAAARTDRRQQEDSERQRRRQGAGRERLGEVASDADAQAMVCGQEGASIRPERAGAEAPPCYSLQQKTASASFVRNPLYVFLDIDGNS